MGRMVNRLTAVTVTKLNTAGLYFDGDGLLLKVVQGRDALTKSWVFCYRFEGKRSRHGPRPCTHHQPGRSTRTRAANPPAADTEHRSAFGARCRSRETSTRQCRARVPQPSPSDAILLASGHVVQRAIGGLKWCWRDTVSHPERSKRRRVFSYVDPLNEFPKYAMCLHYRLSSGCSRLGACVDRHHTLLGREKFLVGVLRSTFKKIPPLARASAAGSCESDRQRHRLESPSVENSRRASMSGAVPRSSLCPREMPLICFDGWTP